MKMKNKLASGSSILDRIVAKKRLEVAADKLRTPASRLEESALFERSCISFREHITHPSRSGIIAEFKGDHPVKD